MQENSRLILKRRMSALFMLLFFLAGGIIAVWWGIAELMSYLQPQQTVLLVKGSIAFICSPILVIPFIYMCGYSFITGKMCPSHIAKLVVRAGLVFLVVGVVSIMILSFYYTNHLESLGYTACPGIPMGWMPGMAVEYVINAELCNK